MTTVAVKHGMMAADSARWIRGTNFGPACKIRSHGGLLVGCAGDSFHCDAAQRWFAAGQPQDDRPDIPSDYISVLALDQEGCIWVGNGELQLVKLDRDFVAIGSGADIALGAMAAGCNAFAAVSIASQYDEHSRHPVDCMTIREAA